MQAITAIKPTGTPHLGNYLGALRPALELAQTTELGMFVADVHALNQVRDPALMRRYSLEVAATVIALDTDRRVELFRQSDVPETLALAQLLGCYVGKGHFNRSHAYKTRVEANVEAGRAADDGVNMGLFAYPLLMAADIIAQGAAEVPVGYDQRSHVELARDIAQAFNSAVGESVLVVPRPLYQSEQLVVGLDGRKMSKSYDNTIEIFERPRSLRKKVMSIVTDSCTVKDAKDPDTDATMALYRLLAPAEAVADLEARYRAGGMGYGVAKSELLAAIEREVGELRSRYDLLIEEPERVEVRLADGAEAARRRACRTLDAVRQAAGLR